MPQLGGRVPAGRGEQGGAQWPANVQHRNAWQASATCSMAATPASDSVRRRGGGQGRRVDMRSRLMQRPEWLHPGSHRSACSHPGPCEWGKQQREGSGRGEGGAPELQHNSLQQASPWAAAAAAAAVLTCASALARSHRSPSCLAACQSAGWRAAPESPGRASPPSCLAACH